MSRLRFFLSGLTALCVGALAMTSVVVGDAHAAPPAPKKGPTAGEFDYYILALLWTPEECVRSKGKNIPPYCDDPSTRPGFMVRGLWPEYEQGGQPINCGKPPAVAPDMLEAMRPIMGADETIQQQWRKHGACTALSVDFYFADLRIAFERVKLPEIFKRPTPGFSMSAIEAVHRIADANPELPPESIAGVCNKKRLIEVRVCVNKDLEPRTCGPRVTANCSDDDSMASP